LAGIEVCFSPALYPYSQCNAPFTTVVVDILRATTAITAALYHGVKEIIPLETLEEAREYKARGFKVAAERDGRKLDFADYGNSAFSFTQGQAQGETIAYSTTNGTSAIAIARNADEVLCGAFPNLSVLSAYLSQKKQNVLILCAGWMKAFCLEDSLFAGALTHSLIAAGKHRSVSDSSLASLELWERGKRDPLAYIQQAQHRERLRLLQADDVLEYTFTPDVAPAIPGLRNERLVDITKQSHQTI
jgi:2-phosphosulfolactate phosphatase